MTAQSELWQWVKTLIKPGFQGAIIGVALLTLFLLVNWARLTYEIGMLIPMATIGVGGAAGGVIHHVLVHTLATGGWKKLAVRLISIVLYFVCLWAGLVYGLSLIGQWD